jgi:hypothetical protein
VATNSGLLDAIERLTDTELDTAEHAYTWLGHADAARPGHLEHQPTSVTPASSPLMPPWHTHSGSSWPNSHARSPHQITPATHPGKIN